MSRGVNKVILIGNVGVDPEVRYTPNGNAVTSISLATSGVWKDKHTGNLQEKTEWHRVVFFNRLAEIVGEFVKKGTKVYVEGALRSRKWQDKSGADRYTTEVVVNEMQILDNKGGSYGSNDINFSGKDEMMSSQNNEGDDVVPEIIDDDIPF